MPAKIPKPTIFAKATEAKNGFLQSVSDLAKQNGSDKDTAKTQKAAFNRPNRSNNVQEYLKDYLLAVSKTGCSNSTIRNYKSDINQFFEFSENQSIEELRNKPKLLAFAHYQRDKGLKESSIKRKLVSLTQFKIWLKEQGLLSSEIPLSPLTKNAQKELNDEVERKIIDNYPIKANLNETKETQIPEEKIRKKNKGLAVAYLSYSTS